ncbi:hypothetical protein ACFW04_011602 [Cataglyphis niger]
MINIFVLFISIFNISATQVANIVRKYIGLRLIARELSSVQLAVEEARSKSEAYITFTRFDYHPRLQRDSPCISIRLYRDALIKSSGIAISSTRVYPRIFGKQSHDQIRLFLSSIRARHFEKKKLKKPKEKNVLQWTRGSPGIISLSGKSKICQIVDPNGVTVATSVGKCYHQVKVATVQHEGVWLARYNMYGMLEPIEQKFRIATFDRVIFNANVTRSENGNTRLFCQLEIKDTRPESCSFIRPDGTRLYMTPVIGTERYTAYVYSFTKRERAYNVLECAITIMELEDVDYGAWRCDLKIYSSRSYGTVLRVDYPDSRGNNNTKGEMIKIRTDDVYVKRGDPFTIKCIADAALKYCWLRSPNGTSYSVTEDTKIESPIILHYQGNGLSFGECGVEISAAVHSDDGRWSCLMGMVDGGEQAATMSVTVTETYLVAEQTEIAVSARNDPVLSCHILPRMLDRTVHYCRWIRPDGYGIYNDISHRYTTNSSYSDCRLVILNYYPEEDDGNWTCVAGLVGKNGHLEEAWDNVMCHEIPYASSMTVFIVKRLNFVVIGITLIVVVFGTLSYVWGRYRLRRMMSRGIINGSPSYSPHVYYPSKSLQPKFDI